MSNGDNGSVGPQNGGSGIPAGTGNQLVLTTGVAGAPLLANIGTGLSLTGSGPTTALSATGTAGVSTFSAGSTGLTPNSPASGSVTLGGTLNAASGGTGVSSTSSIPVTATGSTTSRTTGTRAADRINVLDWGLDPTGATDNTSIFQSMVTATQNQGSGVYWFPSVAAGHTYKFLSTGYVPDHFSVLTDGGVVFSGGGSLSTFSDTSVFSQGQANESISSVTSTDSNTWAHHSSLVVANNPIYGTACSISGTVLTVGGTVNGTFAVGQKVFTATAVGSIITTQYGKIVSLGTGTGGAGTYNLDTSSTVATTTIYAGTDYEKAAGYDSVTSYDPSSYARGTSFDTAVAGKDAVGRQMSANIIGTIYGRAWGGTAGVTAGTGSDGLMNGFEIDINASVSQAENSRFNSKSGLLIVNQGAGQVTNGSLITSTGSAFYDGYTVIKGSTSRYSFLLRDLSTYPSVTPFFVDSVGNLQAVNLSASGALYATGSLSINNNFAGTLQASAGAQNSGSGFVAGWNYTNGTGETDFFAYRISSLTGGFNFYDAVTSGASATASLLANLTTSGFHSFNGVRSPNLALDGGTSGTITQQASAVTTSYSLTWPAAVGTTGQIPYLSNVTGTVGTIGWLSSTGTGSVVLNTGATVSTPTVSDYMTFAVQASNPSYAAGTLWYAADNDSLTFFNGATGNDLHLGQEVQIRAYNSTGTTIPAGSAVYINGQHSQFPTIALAQANTLATSNAIGFTNTAIANNSYGYVVTLGKLTGVNTSGFSAGDALYVSTTTAGGITNVAPTSPNYASRVGFCVYSNPANGVVYVNDGPYYVNASQIIGLGTIATQNANAVTVTGGTIDGTTIGGTTPAAGSFSSVNTGTVNAANGTGALTIASTGKATVASGTFAGLVGDLEISWQGASSAPGVQTYVLKGYATFPFNISGLKAWTTSGSANITVQIDSTTVTGLGSVNVTGTIGSPTTATASGSNSVAVGHSVNLVVNSVSSPVGLFIHIDTVRT